MSQVPTTSTITTPTVAATAPRSPWTLEDIQALLFEMREDNPLSIQALLKILTIEATTDIETAAVTRTDRPKLLVNLSFINAHCHSDDEVKAVLLHECLHVLLGHCVEEEKLTFQRHIALDALINSLIHRQLGARYSSFMSRFYENASGIAQWLRPMTRDERFRETFKDRCEDEDVREEGALWTAWDRLYKGKISADELTALGEELEPSLAIEFRFLLGDHGALLDRGAGSLGSDPMSQALTDAIEQAFKTGALAGLGEKDGFGSQQPGLGGDWMSESVAAAHQASLDWRRQVARLLERIVLPSPTRGLSVPTPSVQSMPVLSTTDRRAFLKTLWSPLLPSADWVLTASLRSGQVQVYLDVSGSMSGVLPDLLAVLAAFHGYIQRPFYAFSTEVVPAKIVRGELVAKSTGGTSIECVLAHVEKTRPRVALVVTDGYVEKVSGFSERLGGTSLWAVVTPDGDLERLQGLGLECVQLPELSGRRGGSSGVHWPLRGSD